jgi:hypothetical protein
VTLSAAKNHGETLHVTQTSQYGIEGPARDAHAHDITPPPVDGDPVTTSLHTFYGNMKGSAVVWAVKRADGQGWDIHQQMYRDTGAKFGGETIVNVNTKALTSPVVAETSVWYPYYAVSWIGLDQNGNTGLYQQIFDTETGAKVGGEVLISNNVDTDSSVVMYMNLASTGYGGGYVTMWMTQRTNGSGWDVHQRVFTEAGAKSGVESIVNTGTVVLGQPAISQTKSGNSDTTTTYTFTWLGKSGAGVLGLYQQQYNQAGNKVGVETLLSTDVTLDSNPVATTMYAGSGGILGTAIVWSTKGANGQGGDIHQEFIKYDGTKVEMIVNVDTEVLTSPVIMQTINASQQSSYSYIMSWVGLDQNGHTGLYQQRFNGQTGAKIDGEVLVSNNIDTDSSVVVYKWIKESGGKVYGYVTMWTTQRTDGTGWDIHQQSFDPNGTKSGVESIANTGTVVLGQPAISQTIGTVQLVDNQTVIYTITWIGKSDAGVLGLYQQQYNQGGTKVGGETLLSTNVTDLADFLNGDTHLLNELLDMHHDADDHQPVSSNQINEPEIQQQKVAAADEHLSDTLLSSQVVGLDHSAAPGERNESNLSADLGVATSDTHEGNTGPADALPVNDDKMVDSQNSNAEHQVETDQTDNQADVVHQGIDEPNGVAEEVSDLPQLAEGEQSLNFDNVDQLSRNDSEDGNADATGDTELVLSEHDLLDFSGSTGEIDLGQFATSDDQTVEAAPVVPGDTASSTAVAVEPVSAEVTEPVYDMPSYGSQSPWIDDTDRVVA